MQISLRSPALLAGLGCLVLIAPALPTYGAANPAPRIVSAQMLDRDRDDRADAVRLTYSEPVWHTRDADGRYPFKVGTYKIASVGAARGSRVITILLREKTAKDIGARPSVTYTRTSSRPVLDRARKQAVGQTYGRTVPLDRDGDGYAAGDCGPTVRSVHPGATDAPDLGFLDSNCDKIDGDKARAVFVSTTGSDANPGTMTAPLLTVTEAVSRVGATPADDDVYLAVGDYPATTTLVLAEGSGIYGGYSGAGWTRSATASVIVGAPTALRATGVTGVTLQLLEVTSSVLSVPGSSSATLLVQAGSDVRLEQVVLRAASGIAGRRGSDGVAGQDGRSGSPGAPGSCDSSRGAGGVAVGSGNRLGGRGGDGGAPGTNAGLTGSFGGGGALGGTGGPGGNPGSRGRDGSPGLDGARGINGTGGVGAFTADGWRPGFGESGWVGRHGDGGGGGGGGGGQGGFFTIPGGGNGGGSGGEGGAVGQGAPLGGSGGGGSVAAVVWESSLTLVRSTLVAGDGGGGGLGAAGGAGGSGGLGGPGAAACPTEIGVGGNGGRGGNGGAGGHSGGGAGGASVALVTSAAIVAQDTATVLRHGVGGSVGFSPAGGASNGTPGLAADRHDVL